jgi:predicted nuclease of restriction endonuclease-like (RecB) superfamily
MRLFYIKYKIVETVSQQLSWSHYIEFLKISEDKKRSFYEKQTINEKWSVRELKRQKNSMLFERLTLNKNNEDKNKLVEK